MIALNNYFIKWSCFAAAFIFFLSTAAADYYVATNGNHVYPYDDISKAATNIQAAVTAAVDNSTIWVSGGQYSISASNATVVTISDKSLALRGASGKPADTIIDGAGTNRGIYVSMTAPRTVLIDGFTITNCSAATIGGGVCLSHTAVNAGTGIVQNCIIVNNDARGNDNWYGGGGIYSRAANPSGFLTVVSNCTIAGNRAVRDGGGGASFYYGTVLMQDCIVRNNAATNYGYSTGGGIRASAVNAVSLIKNCIIESNSALYFGAGVYNTSGADMENCIMRRNYGPYGVGIFIAGNSRTNVLRNCLISENRATAYACGVEVSDGSALLENCTIVTNVTLPRGAGYGTGGFFQTGASSTSILQNTVAYFNYGPSGRSNYTITAGTCSFRNSCAAPLPAGSGNTSNNPLFAAATGGDYHPVAGSPCINAGKNETWMDGAKDLDSRTRIDIFSRIVDMGVYEYHPQGLIFKMR